MNTAEKMAALLTRVCENERLRVEVEDGLAAETFDGCGSEPKDAAFLYREHLLAVMRKDKRGWIDEALDDEEVGL